MDQEQPQFISGNPKFGGKKKINKKIKKTYRQINRGINALGSGTAGDIFDAAAEEAAPLAQQIKSATSAFSDVQDPSMRSQLVRSAEQAVRSNRKQERSEAIGNMLNAIQLKQGNLNTLLGERQFSRNIAAQNYLDKASRRNALQAMVAQKNAGLEFFGDAPGQYFLKTGQTSPAESSPWSTVLGPNNKLYTYNEKTNELNVPVDPITGDPIIEEDPLEKLIGNSLGN